MSSRPVETNALKIARRSGRGSGRLGFPARASLGQWGVAVLLVAFLQRLGLWLVYAPVSYSDSNSYWRIAAAIRENWGSFDGTRTPGYSLLLAAAGNEAWAWLLQMGMGLAITFILFYLGWMVSGRAWFAGLAGLAHTLSPGQLFFEANLLSETAATFWLALAALGVFLWLYRPGKRSYGLALALALAASMAWLTRPLFIYLPFWIALFLACASLDLSWPVRRAGLWKSLKTEGFRLGFLLGLTLLVAGGWLAYMRLQFGMLSLSTMTGYHMVQHTGAFFEYVPEEYAEVRDTYLRYRTEQIARRGSQTNTIWAAIPELQQVSGENFYGLSDLLARISARLIREHPDLYLGSVLKGWWYFWRAPVYWQPEALAAPWLAAVLGPLVLLGRLGTFGINLLFLASSLLAGFPSLRRAWNLPAGLVWLAGTVWIASLLQALADHGDNPRFLVPLQSFVVLWVFWIANQTVQNRIKNRQGRKA